MKKIVVFAFLIILFFLICLLLFYHIYIESAQNTYNKKVATSYVKNDTYQPSLNFIKYQSKNPDFIGWITIEGTAIDYPVMKNNSEPDKYLYKDFYGNESYKGEIFMDPKSEISSNALNMLIYGHNVKDGSMFYDLKKFKDVDFSKKHMICFETIYGKKTYAVFSVFEAEIGKTFEYYNYSYINSERDFFEYLDKIRKEALFYLEDVSYGDEMITLSTCSYHVRGRNGRLVIVAKEIK